MTSHQDAAATNAVEAEAAGWLPEFAGQRPPFMPGNEIGLVHGAWSPRKVDPIARDLVERVLAEPATEYLTAAHWRPALFAWARAEAQVQLLSEYLAKRGEEAGDGVGNLADKRTATAYLLLHRAEARAQSGRARLGLDPLSSARLHRNRAATQLDAARLFAELERQAKANESGASDDDEEGDDGAE